MISASSSACPRKRAEISCNTSARSSPANPCHLREPFPARSTAASTSSREETCISPMPSPVAGLMTCIVLSGMLSFRSLREAPLPPTPQRANSLEVDGYVLRLQVLLDALYTSFAAEARVLDAAERGGGVGDHALVEADHAGFDALADAQSALQVAGVDVGYETVLGIVGGGYGSFFRIEGGDRSNGAEDLLLQERRVPGDFVEDGGAVEVARALHLLGADHDAGAFAEGVFYEIGDLLALVAVDEGAYLDALLGAAPDLHGFHTLRELLGELVRNAVCDMEAVGGGARLADVAHLGDHGALDRRVDVGVVEDEERGVAAEFHRDAQELLGRLGDELAPYLGRAREGELAGARIGDKWSHRAAGGGARHHVQDAAGKACLLQDPGEGEHGEGGLLGRLHHHRATGGNGRPYLARPHRQREVPRRYEQARTDGLLHREHASGARRGDGVAALDADRLLGEPAEELGGVGDLRLRFRYRLAHLQGHQERKLVGALHYLFEGAAQDLTPLPRRRLAPLGLRLVGCTERGHRVLGRGVGHLAECFGGRGVLDDERVSPGGVAPLPPDKELLVYAIDYGLLGGCDTHGSPLRRGLFLSCRISEDRAARAARAAQGHLRLRDRVSSLLSLLLIVGLSCDPSTPAQCDAAEDLPDDAVCGERGDVRGSHACGDHLDHIGPYHL